MIVTEWLNNIEFWHWWVLAAVFVAIEVFAPTTLFLWLGIAARIVGLVLLFADGLGWQSQVFLFAALSVVSVFVWRYLARRNRQPSEGPQLNRRAQQYVDRVFTLTEPIVNHRGKIKVDDTTWTIEGEDLDVGVQVKVVGVDGVILKVEEA